MNTVNTITADTFLSFVNREGIDNKNGLLRAERFDAEFSQYTFQDGLFTLTRHNGTQTVIGALELFGKCQLPSQLPLGNGRIDSALDGKTQERKTAVEKAPTTPKMALMNDIRKAMQHEAATIAERAKEYLDIPNHIQDDTLDSYLTIVEAGNEELVIAGIAIDTTLTSSMIGKQKLSETIMQAENCFAGINGVSVTVEPNDKFTELAIMAQHFDPTMKEGVEAKLDTVFGAKCAKWQVIPAFRTAIVNVRLPKQA